MKGMGASCTASRRGVIFSVASARPTGLGVKSARSTKRKGEAGKIPAMFIAFLEQNETGSMRCGGNACIVYGAFNSMVWAQ
jgi:hypothetical protein